ncbi:MAG: LysR family transcriptional regulator [Microvirga sp.]|jgi:DNA-binding transcriptional LysR family regulator|nr:LysR family transcriptional regulator [Microvirga sp.]
MRITHRHLEAFRAVYLAGGFTKGAQLLGISQPSISRLVQQLQQAVGFTLFTRIDARTVPTAEALALHQGVERSFHGLDEVMQHADNIRHHRVGSLRIVSMPALAHAFLPGVLARFMKERPGVVATLQIERTDALPHWITSQQFDIGFANLPVDKPGIQTELFDEAEGVCVMPAAHSLSAKKFIEPKDLRNVPFIHSGPNGRMQASIRHMFEDAGVHCDVQIETPLAAVACRMVEEGAGVTIVDPFTAHLYERQGLVARPFRPELKFNFGVLFPSYAARSTLVRQFMSAVSEERDRILGRAGGARSRARGTAKPPSRKAVA